MKEEMFHSLQQNQERKSASVVNFQDRKVKK